ncbi:hypothetical protein KY317_03205 [Candidatus Woesearchaeota archaeon]|nr:hypothetical protein [Candidatus Woesearchaeota archaeon]
MAEDTYKNLKKGMHVAKKYVAKAQARNWKALIDAAESIDYEFKKLDEPEVQDKYMKTFYDSQKKYLKDELKIEGDDQFLDTLLIHLGGITRHELVNIVQGLGSDFTQDDLLRELDSSKRRFQQQHYMGVGKRYVTDEKHVAHALKYLGISEDVKKEIAPEQLHELFAHGGKVPYHAIPHEIRKRKKKK